VFHRFPKTSTPNLTPRNKNNIRTNTYRPETIKNKKTASNLPRAIFPLAKYTLKKDKEIQKVKLIKTLKQLEPKPYKIAEKHNAKE
jgi:hypothetical protein